MGTELSPQNEVLDNLAVLPFKFKHLSDLRELSTARGGELDKLLTMKELPKIGCVVYLGKTPIAAGFLRRVEPNHGMFDSFFTNPYFGNKVRHEALLKVIEYLLEEAKNLNLNTIIAFTKDAGIFERAIHIGFQLSDYTTLIKNL